MFDWFSLPLFNSLSLFPGADPHKENFEPLYFREEDCCDEEREEEDEDEGYIPGTTPLNMAANTQVQKLVNWHLVGCCSLLVNTSCSWEEINTRISK